MLRARARRSSASRRRRRRSRTSPRWSRLRSRLATRSIPSALEPPRLICSSASRPALATSSTARLMRVRQPTPRPPRPTRRSRSTWRPPASCRCDSVPRAYSAT
jgi:hypothetical protein